MRRQRVFGSASGVTLLAENLSTPARGMTTRIANTFNSGWQLSDIRRAYLADVDVGSAGPAPNLVTNGTFDTDTSGWGTGQGATLSIDANRLLITNGNFGFASQFITVALGKTYILTGAYTAGTATTARLVSYVGNQNGTSTQKDVGSGPFSMVFVGQGVSCPIGLQLLSGTAGQTGYFDNISVREVVADRSYKAAGANITGTLTKTQVAAASQLVAYSGFSAANYLREPYSADLDFGTSEWSASAWVNVPVTLPASSFPVVTQLASDPEFTSGTGGFSGANYGGGTVTWDGTGAITTTGGSGFANAGRFFASVASRTYRVRIKVSSDSLSAGQVRVGAGYSALNGTFYVGAGLIHDMFVVASGNDNLSVTLGSAASNAADQIKWDFVSVQEVSSSLVADRAHSTGPKVNLGVDAGGKLSATAFDGTTTRTVTTTAAYNTATWLKARAFYTTDGTLGITVNGVEVAVTRGTPLLTLNNSNAVLTIGNSFAADAPFPGSIALLKFSATVPTAEQALWMYEQEKQMFRDGAQVTLPDAGSIVDLTYDDATDKWIAVSSANESEWSGLVRTSVMASPAGSYTKTVAASGIQMHARSTTNPGVDINIPAYGLREELVNRSQAAARLARNMVAFDYVGGFTANTTTGATSITSVASLTYPVSYVGARISGAGIPANTTVVGVSGTTIYISAAATATASGVQISFVDFNLPLGYEAREVLTAGLAKIEGATKDFTRLFDGFKETIRFGTAPGYNAAVQIQATRSAS